MAIVESILEAATEHAEGRPIKRLVVEIGKLSSVLPDAIRFCFEIASDGTATEGAELEIVRIDGTATCRACGTLVVLEKPLGRCTCGGIDLEWVSGTGIKIVRMEVG